MLETFTLSPDIFDKSTFEHRSSANLLITLLQDILQFGFIADLNKSQWARSINDRVNELPPKYKHHIQSIFEQHSNRIIRYPKTHTELKDNPVYWQQVIKESDLENSIAGIFYKYEEIYQSFTNDDRYSHFEEYLFNAHFKNTKNNPVQCDMTYQGLTKLLKPILKFSSLASVIDPYFGKNGSIENTILTLKIISDLLGKRNPLPLNGIIEIHTTFESFKNYSYDKIRSFWSNEFKKLKSRHCLHLYIYKENVDTPRFHNRHLRTKHAIIVSGESFGVCKKAKTNEITLNDINKYSDTHNMISVSFNSNIAQRTADYHFCLDANGIEVY
jgi:hypothetical protein